jgi:hypothetical protein
MGSAMGFATSGSDTCEVEAMPTRPSKNVVQKVIEFPPEQAEAVEAFAGARGETFKAVVLHALRRHLKYPPPPPAPEPAEPLPDSPAVADQKPEPDEKTARKKPKKGST